MAKTNLNIDDYTIIKSLGIGARSIIYLATDEKTKQTIALKRSVFERPEDSRIFEQMENEYKISNRLDHPYLRKCYKLIKVRKGLRVKELLMAMEMFDGFSLEDATTLSLGDVLLVFRMVATGLNAMHQNGYIHCDIKPNNILFNNQSGAIKIIDLGQSCKIGTIKTRIQGTPDYIAPEQVRRQRLDQRTDVFNLGATMYWAFTGKNVPTLIPQQKNDLMTMAGPPAKLLAPHEVYPKIPLGISKLVMDCVKDLPSQRPASMPDIISRLDLLVHSVFGDKIKNGKSNN